MAVSGLLMQFHGKGGVALQRLLLLSLDYGQAKPDEMLTREVVLRG